MCGIAGIVNFDNTEIDQTLIENLKRSLKHRGPDNSSHKYLNKNICFVHTRLSIIDLSERSNQPLSDQDEKYTIVFNGEIYNYKELREELIQFGINFETNGDTEVLLKGYIKHGSNFLCKLRGQFAFAIYDRENKELFLARDRVGIKPFYYSITKNNIIFSSELKAIENLGIVNFQPNKDAYVSYLRHLCVPQNQTGNENIYKLQPGEFMKIDTKGKFELVNYWDPFDIKINEDITINESKIQLNKLLKESVEYRKVSDVEVGLFISGGLDSSLLGKLMKNSDNVKLTGFNIDYDEHFEGYKGEVQEAKLASKYIGINLVEEKITYNDFKKIFDNYSFYEDDLIGDEVGIPLFFLGKASRQNNIKVVQVGEGADELFYGYDHWHRLLKLNKFLQPIFKSSKEFSKFTNHRLNLISNILFNRTIFSGGAIGFNLSEINYLLKDGLNDEYKLINYVDKKWIEYFSQPNSSLYKWMTLIDLKIRIPELLLMRMDKLVMQSGVEARVPFLDHKLVEFILSLPQNHLINSSEQKFLLKQVASNYLPKEISHRKKQGFRAPIGEWIKKDAKSFNNYIFEFNDDTKLFNDKSLKKILEGFDYQKKWYLLNLSRWHLNRI